MSPVLQFFFFFNDTATTEIYTLSLHDALPVARHPRPDSQLGVPVPRGRVDVIDPVPEEQVERAVRVRLAGPGQRGSAEEGHRAEVTGPSERSSLDHRAGGSVEGLLQPG